MSLKVTGSHCRLRSSRALAEELRRGQFSSRCKTCDARWEGLREGRGRSQVCKC